MPSFPVSVSFHFIQVFGRRTGFIAGACAGILSGLVCAWALRIRCFPLFIFGAVLLGVFDGFSDFLRFAAAEAVKNTLQGPAVAFALTGGAVCSVLGPELASVASQGAHFERYYDLATFLGCVFLALCCFIHDDDRENAKFTRVASGPKYLDEADIPRRRPLLEIILTTPELIVSILASMSAQWSMMLVMSGLPLAMVNQQDFKFHTFSRVIQFHLLGMFLPGILTGFLVERLGALVILSSGLCLIAVAMVFGLLGEAL